MHIEDGGCCLIQHPLDPRAALQARFAGEGRYAEMPAEETTTGCFQLIEELHACNVCYSGIFSAESSPVRTDPDAEDGRDVRKTRKKRKAIPGIRPDLSPELSGSL